MNWAEFTQAIKDFFNQPLPVILTSISTVVVYVLVILSKTSFGKKNLLWCRGQINDIAKTATDTNEKVKEVQQLAKEEIASLKADYEQKITIALSTVNFYEESVFSIFEKIPNAQVQAELNNFKVEYAARKQAIIDTIGITYQDYQQALNEKVNEVRNEYENKLAELQKQFDEFVVSVKPYLDQINENLDKEEIGEENNGN